MTVQYTTMKYKKITQGGQKNLGIDVKLTSLELETSNIAQESITMQNPAMGNKN